MCGWTSTPEYIRTTFFVLFVCVFVCLATEPSRYDTQNTLSLYLSWKTLNVFGGNKWDIQHAAAASGIAHRSVSFRMAHARQCCVCFRCAFCSMCRMDERLCNYGQDVLYLDTFHAWFYVTRRFGMGRGCHDNLNIVQMDGWIGMQGRSLRNDC